MSRVEEAQDIVDLIEDYAEAAPAAFINDNVLDRFDIAIMADSVNKEE